MLAPKLIKSAEKSLSQPWCSHSNTIYDAQLQKRIVLRMQPRRQATLMQPFQCISQHHVANLHLPTHMATEHDNNHAAIPLRSANHRFKKRIELRTQEQPLVAEHRGGTNFVANPHVSTHMAIKHNNNHVAIPLRSATADSKTPYHYARASTPKAAWRHRSSAGKKRQTDRSRNRRTQEVPFIAGWSHFTWKNIRFRAPASSPSQAPCNNHAAITTSLSVLLCDAKFHTTVSHRPSLSVLLCDAQVSHHTVSHHTVSHHAFLSELLCDVTSHTTQSHTTLHWVYSYVM